MKKNNDHDHYAALAEKIKKGYQKAFIKNGKPTSGRMCKLVRPIAMGLVDTAEEISILGNQLEKMVRENNYRIGTGFLTTYKILQVLSETGHSEAAYRMLENTKQPGWLYEVDKGATTTWENWFGVDEKGKPTDSHNHFAPGAACSWLFSTCAGIRPLKPGFDEIGIKPTPGGSLKWVECSHECRHGLIKVKWCLEQDVFALDVTLPEDIPAKIELPNGTVKMVTGGVHSWKVRI